MRLVAAALLCVPLAARAHQQSVSFSELRVGGARVEGTLRFSLADLRTQLEVDAAHLNAPALTALVVQPFSLRVEQQPCALQPGSSAHMDGEDGVVLLASWVCPREIDALSVRADFLDTFPGGHTHLSKITFPSGLVAQRVAQAEEPSFDVRDVRSPLHEAMKFLALGVEHIFTGYDHIAFLIGLLLLGGRLRELIKIVTAFTVAHSITLALAALEVLTPPSRVIEPLIAASIVCVGVENLWALRRHTEARALGHRWMLTFAFGLVHGFGFASVLRQLHLPRAALATGLVTFNLGVEVGQVCIVAIALPLLRRVVARKHVARALSLVIAVLGAVWLVQRLV